MNKLLKPFSVLVMLGLAGCATNPMTGELEINRTAVGAVVGTVAGGLIGAAIGDSRAALIGAAIGAGIGGGTGLILDRKHGELESKLKGTGLTVEKQVDDANTTQALVVNAPADITFSTGSADLQSQSFPSLARLAESLRNQGNLRIEITGHTDNTGPFRNNLRLSYNRAHAVGQFLYAGGIQADRIAIRGVADTMPVAGNETPAGRQANRRVELRISAI
ncbi:OmpA family protein [Pseudomonas sp. NC26]|jgi:outer membrane protein OmpA-like peptidoglycan-associated protein|uniref:OmpA family protein n=1 Tax=Pseudomonas sp. NC26 TaxID=3114535 RepID=UPI002DEE26CF|nr:OmpA family protein [Pseudomonas sp. NC26]